MLLDINKQIELNYKFQHLIFDDDVEIDINNIADIIIECIDEFNDDNNLNLSYDDIFLNIDVADIIEKKIKLSTNLLYKILTYHDNILKNISTVYDPLNNYDDDVNIPQIIYLLNEFYDDEIINSFYIENDNEIVIEYYDNDIVVDKFDELYIISFFSYEIKNIADKIIDEIDYELSKSYNKINHVKIKCIE